MDRDPPSLPPDLRDHLDDDEAAHDLDRIWAHLPAGEADDYDVDEEWERLSERLDLDADAPPEPDPADDRAPQSPARGTALPSRRWTRTAGALLLLVVALGLGAWWASQPVTVSTPAGQQATVTLPDGSTVDLNGATTLTYPRGFTDVPLLGPTKRQVTLSGEAFFSVVDQEQPFRVRTANAEVTVLGTEFNVRARAEAETPTTRVALAAGSLRVASEAAGDRRPVVLSEAGQASRVSGMDEGPTPPRSIDLKYVEAWRQGGFALTNAPLPTILRELERRFGTTLQLRVPSPRTDTMTLHYATDVKLENVLRDICLIQNLSYRETSQGYELIRK